VPPPLVPAAGFTVVSVGTPPLARNPPASVSLPLSTLLTTTFTGPTAGATLGVTQSMRVALTTFTPVAATPPMVTVAFATKLLPLMVMAVVPPLGPAGGLTDAIDGVGPVAMKALVIVAVGFFYLEGLPQLFVYGLAVLDVPVSLYVYSPFTGAAR